MYEKETTRKLFSSSGLNEEPATLVSSGGYFIDSRSDEEYDSPSCERRTEYMSFVGISIVEGSVIAFADSKSILPDRFGKYQDDGTVTKIHRFPDFVIVTSGNNVLEKEGHIFGGVPLERWISENLDPLTEAPYSFCEKLQEALSRSRRRDREIGAFIAQKMLFGVALYDAKASPDRLELTKTFVSNDETKVVYRGVDEYVRYFNRNPGVLATRDPKEIERAIATAIERLDREYVVNPVGGPIVTAKCAEDGSWTNPSRVAF